MASTIKVDNVQNQPGTNIVSKCGTDVTIGASGDTVALACGASQTGFGRTGTVDWDTSIHTGTVTAATGKGYFVNTTSGGITVNLPAAAVGSIVAVSDYASTADSNNITVAPNGSEKINGVNADYTISTAGLAVTLVYADATRGWKSVTGSDADSTGLAPAYITATVSGACNTLTTVDTNYKIAKFLGPGTFCVSAGNGPLSLSDYMVVAGGGGGGTYGGGGGAGGYRESHCATTSGPYTASPLAAPNSPSTGSLSISPGPYSIVIGAGGAVAGTPGPSNPVADNGNPSTFSSITSAGGGGGGSGTSGGNGGHGGSGGASGPNAPSGGGTIGNGNTPPVSPPQGNNGGMSDHLPGVYQLGGGGGGAGAVGNGPPSPGSPSATSGGIGGAGVTTEISGSPVAYAGGGGGGSDNPPRPGAPGGTGGGGTGGTTPPTAGTTAGTANTGGGGGAGGGGCAPHQIGSVGGSGIVYIRYRFQ